MGGAAGRGPRAHPQVAPDRILQMGTLDAAAALGCDAEVGSLEPGKRADLALVSIQSPAVRRTRTSHSSTRRQRYAGTMCGGGFADQRRQQ